MNNDITPKPGDMLEEVSRVGDFKARYIVLSVIQDKHAATHGNSYRLYTLYVESSSECDRSLQGTIDIAYNLEINDYRGGWSIFPLTFS